MAGLPDDKLFRTMPVGSLPRPQWVRDLIEDRKAGRVRELDAEALLDAAIPSAIRMQERAGLDFVSDGEWRRESYVKVFADSVEGFEPDLIPTGGSGISGLFYPAVVSRLVQRRSFSAVEAAFLRGQTNTKVSVAIPSPYTIGRRMWSAEHSKAAYGTAEDFMEACVPIIREEVKALTDLGVNAIQLDDPWLVLLVDPEYRKREGITDIEGEIESSVKYVNAALDGVDPPWVSVHLCHAHWDRSHGSRGPYDAIIGALGRMNVDRFAMEFATPDAGGVEVLKDFPEDKVLGLGVIDHTDPHIETPEEVVERVERVMEYVPKERITLNPDCGFAPSSANPMDFDEAYMKLRAMCEGADLLREKYG